MSSLPYDEERDERMGSNKIVIADEDFNKVGKEERGKREGGREGGMPDDGMRGGCCSLPQEGEV